MKVRTLAVPLVAALCLNAAATFAAETPAPPATASHPASLEQAVKQVQRQTHGHILAADTIQRGQGKVYRVKVLTPHGEVRVLQLHSTPRPSAASGRSHTDRGGR